MTRFFCMLLAWTIVGLGGTLVRAQNGSSDSSGDLSGNRAVPHVVTLSGPFEGVRIECGVYGSVSLDFHMLQGEQRELRLLLPVAWQDLHPEERSIAVQGGQANVPAAVQVHIGESLPGVGAGVTGSSLPWPYLPNPAAVLPVALALVLVAFGTLMVALRRRAWLALGASLLMSTFVIWFAWPANQSEDAGAGIRLMQRDSKGNWSVVDSARSVLHIDGSRIENLLVTPPSAPVLLRFARQDGELRLSAQSGGALLRARYAVDPGVRTLQSDMNTLAPLQALWVRTAQSAWQARGGWGLGAALPLEPLEAEPAPPSWLVSALPQGPRVWVALLAPGSYAGGLSVDPRETWLQMLAAEDN